MNRPPRTLVDRLGGVDAVHAVVDELYSRVGADPALAPYFRGVDLDRQRAHLAEFLVAVLGPSTRPAADPAGLTAAHARLRVSDDAFDRMAGHLLDTLAQQAVGPTLVDDVILQVAALRPHVLGPRAHR